MRPRVLLNCAASLDGRLAAPDGSPMRFSDEDDLRRVHGLRAACDAILVGVGTVLADDPSLRVKPEYAEGSDPLRVVLDAELRTPARARVLDGSAPVLVFHGPSAVSGLPPGWTDAVPVDARGHLDLEAVLSVLHDGGVQSVLVEGGAEVLGSFLRSGLWDEWTLYQAPVLVGGGPALPGAEGIRLVSAEQRGAGVLWTFRPAPPT